MRYLSIFTVFLFMLYVNARILNKRDVTAPTQTCITDINKVETQGQVVINGLQSYTASQGYIGILTIQAQISTLETNLKTAQTDCCSLVGIVSDEDSTVLLAAVEDLTLIINNILTLYETKLSEFNSNPLVLGLAKDEPKQICSIFEGIVTCLGGSVSAENQYIVEGYGSTVTSTCDVVVPLYS